MTTGLFILPFLIFIAAELATRVVHYSRKPGLSVSQKIILVFFGRWLVNEYSASPVYLKEIAASLGVDTGFMVSVLAEASGKDAAEIQRIFLGKSGGKERSFLSPLTGFIPAPCMDLGHTTTNSQGFRGTDVPRNKGPRVKRVILLGGSVAFGRTATSDAATIACQLEKTLNRRANKEKNIRWEVLNLGVPDFISCQELALLIKTGLSYEPDVVISLSGFNDAHHYLATGEVNSPASMRRVATAYDAFFGGSLHRLIAFLGTFMVSVEYLGTFIQRLRGAEEEELSPFIYTIW